MRTPHPTRRSTVQIFKNARLPIRHGREFQIVQYLGIKTAKSCVCCIFRPRPLTNIPCVWWLRLFWEICSRTSPSYNVCFLYMMCVCRSLSSSCDQCHVNEWDKNFQTPGMSWLMLKSIVNFVFLSGYPIFSRLHVAVRMARSDGRY